MHYQSSPLCFILSTLLSTLKSPIFSIEGGIPSNSLRVESARKMERLIYSNSIPLKRRLNSPVIPQLAQADSPQRLGPSSSSPPSSFAPVPRRFHSVSCSLNVNNSGFLFRRGVDDSPETHLESSVDSGNGSMPEPGFLNWVAQKLSRQQKVLCESRVCFKKK